MGGAPKAESQMSSRGDAETRALHYWGSGIKAAASVLGLVIALAIVWMVIKMQFTQGPSAGAPPRQMIDVVGVRNDLLAIAQAERLYLASRGSHANIDQLQQAGAISFSGANRWGYNYTAGVNDGQHFKITAALSDPAKIGWPTLWIDENMEVSQK